MSKFDKKIETMNKKLKKLEAIFGVGNRKVYYFRNKITMYERVREMPRFDVNGKFSRINFSAAVETLKSGYDYENTAKYERKLLKVLRERIKSDKKEHKRADDCTL